jgi:hypothetical protein
MIHMPSRLSSIASLPLRKRGREIACFYYTYYTIQSGLFNGQCG